MINRRTALRNLAIASGGLITLPLWMQSCGLSDKNTHLSTFSADEQAMLASITDAIIPTANGVGALAMGVDKYLQKLVDDCWEQKDKDNFKKQMAALDASAKKANGNAFAKCTPQQQRDALMAFGASAVKEEKEFFNTVKSETIRGFSTSQKVIVDYLGYKVAPGHFYGCVSA